MEYPIEYHRKIIPMKDGELSVDPLEMGKIIWLLKKWTSYTYIERLMGLFIRFVDGYEDFLRKSNAVDDHSWHRENLIYFRKGQAHLENGLGEITEGFASGYNTIREGIGFEHSLAGPKYEFGEQFDFLGWHHKPDLCVGPYAFAQRAIAMAEHVQITLDAEWGYPSVLSLESGYFGFPESVPPFNENHLKYVNSEEEVPVSGIWRPMGIPACPNYLIAGKEAPKVQLARRRLEYPEHPSPPFNKYQPAKTEYDYDPFYCRWGLVWADNRYRKGRIPVETEFLDPSTDFPKEE